MTPASRGGAARPVSRSGTRRGRSSARPAARYDAPAPVERSGRGLVVEFVGRDGRRKRYDFAELAVPGLREELAAAFAVRVGVTGTLHTLASANNAWSAVRRFTAFLATVRPRPDTPRDHRVAPAPISGAASGDAVRGGG